MASEFPKLITSSVVRGSEKGQSHGGVYIVDFASQSVEQHIDWNKSDIDFSGRGGGRGRGGGAVWGAPGWVGRLWGEAGAPGGTVRRAAVRKRGPALLVSISTDFPNDYG